YTVLDGRPALTPVLINQQVAPSGFTDAGAQWQGLGNCQIRSGSLVVQLSDLANGNVIADAIRLQWLAPLPQGPVVQVSDGSTTIPNTTGSDSFGTTFVGTAVSKTFTITNLGTQNVVLTGPITVPAGFTLTSSFGTTTVAPGASTTFTVRMDATTPGTYSGNVSFGTNDPNNNPFNFPISGTVSAVSILDDSNPGFSTVGSWTFWTNQGYLGNIHEATAMTGADVATWLFSNLPAGLYQLSATWTAYTNRATNAPYKVLDGTTSLCTVLVNQQVAPSGFSDAGALWQNLGNFQIRSGTLYVQLSDAANGNVEADAIRIQWLGPLPSTPPIHGIHDPGIGDSDQDDDHSQGHFKPLPVRPRRDIDGDDICDHDSEGRHLGWWVEHAEGRGQTH